MIELPSKMLLMDGIMLALVYIYINFRGDRHAEQIDGKKWGILHIREAWEHGVVMVALSVARHSSLIVFSNWLYVIQTAIFAVLLLIYYWTIFDGVLNLKRGRSWGYNPIKDVLGLRTWVYVPDWALKLELWEVIGSHTVTDPELGDWVGYRFMGRKYDKEDDIWLYWFIPQYSSILDYYRYKMGAFEIIFKSFLLLLVYFLYIVSFNIY